MEAILTLSEKDKKTIDQIVDKIASCKSGIENLSETLHQNEKALWSVLSQLSSNIDTVKTKYKYQHSTGEVFKLYDL